MYENRTVLRRVGFGFLGLLAGALCLTPLSAQSNSRAAIPQLSEGERSQAFALADDYMSFMDLARTETTTVSEVRSAAEREGFRAWQPGEPLSVGGRYYIDNRGRSIALVVVGSQPIASGVRAVAAHIDSPRLELKARPLYESEGFALFQTEIHGNILTYQWANIPLALIGQVNRRDGSQVQIRLGLDRDDPVFVIAALAPHVDIDQRERTQREVLMPEELDPLVGLDAAGGDQGIVDQVLAHLDRTYGIGVDDLVSAELALVPAFAPHDVGFDRSMMAMYGQDDRFSAYAAVRAMFDLDGTPPHTAIVYLADNEEVGNTNNTGASSSFFRDLVAELLLAQMGQAEFRDVYVSRTLRESRGLSLDVNDGINPTWPSAWEPGNAPRLGRGVNLKMYGQGMDANSEYTAWFRDILDRAEIPWQTATYKIGRASGGTLGRELSRLNMDVIDVGAPVLSIHSTYDVSAKADLWWLYRTNLAFLTAP